MRSVTSRSWGVLLTFSAFACADPAPGDEADGGGGGNAPIGGEGLGATPFGGTFPDQDVGVTGGQPNTGGMSPSMPMGGGVPVGGGAGGAAPGGLEPPPDAMVPVERPPVLVAAIVLAEQPQVPLASAAATVTAPGELPNQPGCTVVDVDPNAQAAPTPGYDAGVLRVSGAASALEFVPSPDGALGTRYQASPAPGDDVFADGAMLTASGAGGPQFPAFEVSVAAPNRVVVQEPRAAFGETNSVGDDLVVRWTPGQSESLLVTLLPAQLVPEVQPQRGKWVFCAASDASGTVTIPADQVAAVGDEPDFPFGQGALVIVTRTRVGTTQVGPDTAAITASTSEGVPVTLVQ
jgi:hypothetical protein